MPPDKPLHPIDDLAPLLCSQSTWQQEELPGRHGLMQEPVTTASGEAFVGYPSTSPSSTLDFAWPGAQNKPTLPAAISVHRSITFVCLPMGSAQCSASGCVCPKGDGENAKVVEDRVGAGFVRAAALGPAYIFEDGATYTGQWKGNMRHGYGVHVEADGSKYEGEWIEDKAHGEGRLEHSDGATYDGTWRGSMKHGHGTYIHSDGSKYTGDWLNDLQSGQGTEEWSDGATYSGQYTAGRKNGTGKYAWPNGSHFEGEFVDNDIHGYGVYVWTDGCVYRGQWTKQQMHGQGEFQYPDGRKYEGTYVKSQKEGYGKLSWPDGRLYEGHFAGGEMHGQGVMTAADGTKKEGVLLPAGQSPSSAELKDKTMEALIQLPGVRARGKIIRWDCLSGGGDTSMAHLNLHQHAQHMVEMTEVFLAKDNLANSWSIFEDDMAQLNQSMVALTALLLGTLLAARGFAIMKPTFVLSTALALGTRTFSVACREGQLIPGVISALVVFACPLGQSWKTTWHTMADLQKSASSPALMNAGAAMSHVPKRATQHALFLASWEVPPACLKPGQATAGSRVVYSEEAPDLKTTYLSELHPPKSMYADTVSALTTPQDYKNPVQPIRQKEPPASSVGHRGASHWSSTYKTSHDDNAIVGSVYHRQTGPSYQAANPPTCIGGAGSISSMSEDFGVYGSDPRSKVDPMLDRIPIRKTALTAGTPKGTLHIPGYNGFLPLNTRNPYCARVESGTNLRTNDKSHITDQYHVNTLFYAGHVPLNVTNDFGAVNPGTRSTISRSFRPPNLKAFDI
eukprot:symbB.v1.2.011778.t2/scaffold750.1/size323489/30